MRYPVNRLTFLFFLLILSQNIVAQLIEQPVPQYNPLPEPRHNARGFSQAAKLDTLQLPFWDDFSFSGPGVDTTLWQNGVGIFINPAIGINQPTINVATFDGINAKGRPYSTDLDFVSPTDSLVSHAIDLSTIAVDKQNTVYFSFFWQMKGLGEQPDEKDSIRVDFLNNKGQWVRQWSKVGLEENKFDEFKQVYIAVNESQYFHPGFRIKIQSFGKPTGAFDSWHIDYIYLNQDRKTTNESIFDHAIATEPLSLFNTYTTIPYSQLFAFPDTIFAPARVVLQSFENNIQPVEYNYTITDKIANTTVYHENSTINPLPAYGRDEIESNKTEKLNKSYFNANTDSLHLSVEFQFVSGDKYLIKSIDNGGNDTTYLVNDYYNYRLNDTIRKEVIIHDVLAYDDGSAEFAAGINQSNGQIALQYVIAEQDSITGIDIYFPLIKPIVAEGEGIDLLVYKSLSDEAGALLAKQNFTIQPGDSINQFTRYTFERPVIVSDTFYIGFQQYKDDFIGIGLDKTHNQGNKIFVNTIGTWDPNLKVEGSLMMRPVFGKTDYDPNAILSVEKPNPSFIRTYPNPVSDRLFVEGQFDHIELFSISGNRMPVQLENKALNVAHLPNGLYVIKAQYKESYQVIKVLVRH